jgi:hypothetical protein
MRVNAAPFAALFVILAAVAMMTPHSEGIPLHVARIAPCGADDRRIFVIQPIGRGWIRINADNGEMPVSKLGDRLDELFSTRAERVAFITARTDTPFADVTAIIDAGWRHADHLALLPPIDKLSRSGGMVCPELVFTNPVL